MAGSCPYLGLASPGRNKGQRLPGPTSLHRCYASSQPERVGLPYQAETCLTLAHRRCPRLLAMSNGPQAAIGPRPQEPGLSRTQPMASSAPAQDRVSSQPRAWDSLRSQLTAEATEPKRPVTLTEIVVFGLGISTLFAFLFVGLIIIYRMQVGPGMSAGPEIAAGPQTTTAPLPSVGTPFGRRALPTLRPTFTPAASSILPAAEQASALTPTADRLAPPTPIALPLWPSASSPPTRLVIPRISLDVPVIPVGTKTTQVGGQSKTVWADVPNGGGFHGTSAYPGNAGNTVINGHRDILGAVFRHLDQVQIGDEITLYVDSAAYSYSVTEILIVPETFATASQRAANLRLIGPMSEERLTLVTCTPLGLATHRLLVIAKPAAEIPQMPQAGSTSEP
jgi:LPXTG-site transpeptidase (sortase) family protein